MDVAQIVTSETYLSSPDGLRIFCRSWRPTSTPKALIAICPGFNSHSGYYSATAESMAAAGYSVHAVDLRGRGKSDGERFYVEDIGQYTSDLGLMIDHAASENPHLPIFLLGHSAGGVTACIYTLDHPDRLAGLICESFAFRVPAPDFALAVLKGLSHVAPHAHVLRLKNTDFSRDGAVVDAMEADPLIAHETQPTRTVAALVRADERLEAGFGEFRLPLLILHGSADRATRPDGSQMFFDLAGSKDKTFKLYEGHFHDMLNDIGREQVLSDILAWIGARLPEA